MTATQIDLGTWDRAAQFRFFRSFERPHFAVTSRLDVTGLKSTDLPVFRTCLWAIGAGLHAVPALRTRFDGDTVTRYDRLNLSPTIAMPDGSFRFTYLPWQSDRAAFDADAAPRIAAVRDATDFNPNDGAATPDVAYLSCLPWLDYTSLDNALPHADDCVPRVSWGKIVPTASGYDMAATIQVHHALVDGRAVGEFFAAFQTALDTLAPDPSSGQ